MPKRSIFALFIIILSPFSFRIACGSQYLLGDLNSDYRVDVNDLHLFSQQWLTQGSCSGQACADFDDNNEVNFKDFTVISQNWHKKIDSIVINEFCASNKHTLLDGDLQSSDWIELYNYSEVPVSLCGWYLTDNPNNLQKWPLPCSLTLEGGSYLVVFASGKDVNDYIDSQGYFHTNFSLDADGEYLALIRPDGTIASEYTDEYLGDNEYGFPSQLADISYGLDFNELSLVSKSSYAYISVPSDDSYVDNWIEQDFQTDSNWMQCQNGVGFSPDNGIQHAGDLLVDLWATDLELGNLTQWNNHGTLGGYFYDEGTGVWTITPEYVISAGFNGSNKMRSNFTAPATITGNSDWSVEAWAYNQQIGDIEALVQWTTYLTTGNDTSCVLSYGSNISSGAIVHIGPSDIGYEGGVPAANKWHHITATYQGGTNGVESIYVDGKLNASEQKTLNLRIQQPFRLGNANGEYYFSGALAAVRVHDGALTAEQVQSNFVNEADYYHVNPPPDMKYIAFYISTNIESTMKGVNSSLYARYEFEIEDVNTLRDNLMLKVYYDDGFVAYLNGMEVARRNCPDSPQWNSEATAERTEQMASTVELIDISGFKKLLCNGKNVLAIQAMNRTVDDSEFLIMPQLISLDLDMNKIRHYYFYKPTPWYANESAFENIVDDVRFSVERGFYEQPFQVRLATDTKEAHIRYTLDGSTPTAYQGYIYDANAPIQINTTTCLRAAGFKQGYKSSPVMTQTYIFLNDVINQPVLPAGYPTSWGSIAADYQMDPDVVYSPTYYSTIKDDLKSIPSVCIGIGISDFFGAANGVYANATVRELEKGASVEYIDVGTGQTFQANAGIRSHGGVGRTDSKHALRIIFKTQYGPSKLDFPLFNDTDVHSFNSLVLRSTWNYSWTGDSTACGGLGTSHAEYIRDAFSRDTVRDMERPTPYGRYVHLYINGLYWGLYSMVERPDDSFAEAHLGGRKEDYDVLKAPSEFATSQMDIISGDTQVWDTMFSIAESDLSNSANYLALQQYLDIPAMIDYMLMIFQTGNRDAPVLLCSDYYPRNFYSIRKRQADGKYIFVPWDCEWSLEDPYVNRIYIDGVQNPHHLFQRLLYNDDFRMLLADNIQKYFFNNGLLTPSKAIERYEKRAQEIYRSIVGESARWGDSHRSTPYTRDIEWIAEVNRIENVFFPIRTNAVIDQLQTYGMFPYIEAPSFYINDVYKYGGQINSGDILSITAPEGTIYYTLDGSDPRLPGGSINPLALIYSGSPSQTVTLIPEDESKKVFVPSSDIGTTWRGGDEPYNDSAWTYGTPIIPGKMGGVGYDNDTSYLPFISYDVKTPMYGNMASCYIRIHFDLTAEQLSRITSLTLKVRCDDGYVAFLNGTEVHSINKPDPFEWNSSCKNRPDSADFVVSDISSFIYELKEGLNILAIHSMNQSTSSSDFLTSAVLEATVTDDSLGLSKSTYVKTRALSSGQWSPLSEAYFAVGPVAQNLRITEIMYHPQEWPPTDPNSEFIELRNISSQTINLQWARFTKGIHFTFPDTELSAGQYIVVVKDINAFQSVYGTGINTVGPYSGSLDNGGERIRLEDCLGRTIHDFEYKDGWRYNTDGEGFSLIINNEYNPDVNSWANKDSWSASTFAGGSPGSYDNGPHYGDIVINETLSHSHGTAADWIELYNTTDHSINIGGWFLSDNDSNLPKYEIAADTNIPAYGYIVFYEDLNFGPLSSDPGALHPFSLSENGDQICLSSGSGGQITGYRIKETFGASQTDISFGRYYKSSTDTYNFVSMSQQTAGYENAYPKVGPVVISEMMYHPEKFWGNWDAEYIELFNITESSVFLYDEDGVPWKFTEGIDFTFPPNTTIPPYSPILVVRDVNAFLSEFTVPAQVKIFAWTDSRLDNGGEMLELSMPGDYDENDELKYIRIDRVNYSDGSQPEDFNGFIDPWPAEADGTGKSLTKINLNLYGNDPNNWTAETPSPGVASSGYEWTLLTYDDFESGWGNYTPGGEDCLLHTTGSYSHSGSNAADIQDDPGPESSFYHTNGIDVQTPAYTQIKVDFWYYPVSMDPLESFSMEYFDGTVWNQVANFVFGTDFVNNQFYNPVVYINKGTSPGQYNFPVNMKIRFACNASSNTDDVYIDDIIIWAK